MDIKNNIKDFQNSLSAKQCKLVAVSKTKPIEAIKVAYEAGIRVFGENKAQELTDKYEKLPKDILWHMIGHMQRNKVKYIAPFVALIHSVDSLKLLKEINKQARKNNRVISCLLQVHIAKEETKFGLDENELIQLLNDDNLSELKNIKIIGLMGMATFTGDKEQVRNEFKYLKNLFDQLKGNYTTGQVVMEELSMGMSGDYEIAIEEGSTMVRIGSAIFGERVYE